jgi:hypothetical protein
MRWQRLAGIISSIGRSRGPGRIGRWPDGTLRFTRGTAMAASAPSSRSPYGCLPSPYPTTPGCVSQLCRDEQTCMWVHSYGSRRPAATTSSRRPRIVSSTLWRVDSVMRAADRRWHKFSRGMRSRGMVSGSRAHATSSIPPPSAYLAPPPRELRLRCVLLVAATVFGALAVRQVRSSPTVFVPHPGSPGHRGRPVPVNGGRCLVGG